MIMIVKVWCIRILGILIANAAWILPAIAVAIAFSLPPREDWSAPSRYFDVIYPGMLVAGSVCAIVGLIGIWFWGDRFTAIPAIVGLLLSIFFGSFWYEGYVEHKAFNESRQVERRIGR